MESWLETTRSAWKESMRLSETMRRVTAVYGDFGNVITNMEQHWQKCGYISAELGRSYVAHRAAMNALTRDYENFNKALQILDFRAKPLASQIMTISQATVNAAVSVKGWIASATGLNLGYQHLTDTLLKFNRSMFEGARTGSLYGESVTTLKNAMVDAQRLTTLSKQEFADLNNEIKNLALGVPPTSREILELAARLQSNFGYSAEETE